MSEELKKLPYKAQRAVDNINDLVKEYEAEIVELNNKIDFLANIPKNEPLLPYKNHPVKIKETIRNSWNYKDDTKYLVTLEQLKTFQKEDEETYTKNQEICARNKKSAEILIQILTKFGLKKTKEEYKSARSYKKITVEQAWVGEVRSLFSLHPGTIPYDLYRYPIEEVEKYEQTQRELKRQEEKQEKKTKKEQEYKVLVASIVKKYNLPDDAVLLSTEDLTDTLAKQNKYLYLARYLAKNRGDWSDGYSLAERGLENFKVELPIDQDISAEINGIISSAEGGCDGRCFRDCTWNYDKLFNMVESDNPELYRDYMKLYELEVEFRY